MHTRLPGTVVSSFTPVRVVLSVSDDASGQLAALHAKYHAVAAAVQQKCADVRSAGSSGVRGKFEWVDGALLKAIESGEWVVIDNANFCNPTVRGCSCGSLSEIFASA